MKAVTWRGVNEIGVEDVPEPAILNDHDIILAVGLSAVCGSDLHLIGGYIPTMRAGDVLGHEFMGTVAEVGPGVTKHHVGERVVVVSFTSCGRCWYCRQELWSLCDNGNPNPGITEALWGQSIGGCYGYSHALGGYAGSHAPYIRVPYADQGVFAIPDGVSDERALFASDAAPTGWTGAHQAEVRSGDVVAVWGAGGVGQMAARAAILMEAAQVVVIDRYENRLDQTPGPQYLYDQVKQQMRLQTDRPAAVREAIYACRKGGTVFTLGVFAGVVDKFPLGAVMNKALTLRGAQQHGHRYIPEILDRMSRDEVKTEHLATHVMPLDDGPKGYRMFKNKEDGCVRAVFRPGS